ncbi:MAG: prepilin-type N-terminal cleavage/methylation domain-containing protein [Eubacterium sp.]|nr:prepilin-type N-terminal cleavage/methylation domain-containing protein [Eubacterium sp.]
MDDQMRKREGFSLIEMIIAIAIVGIVMSGVILLISYSANSMRRTTNTVNLQNETKDALIHMTTYLQEGTDVFWDDIDKALYIIKEKKDSEGKPVSVEFDLYKYTIEETVTLEDGSIENRGVINFIRSNCPTDKIEDIYNDDNTIDQPVVKSIVSSVGSVSTGSAASTVFAKDIIGFDCELLNNSITDGAASGTAIGGRCLRLSIEMKNESGDARFLSTKEVFLRN